MGEDVAELVAHGGEIATVEWVGRDHKRHLFLDNNAMGGEGPSLAWVVSQKTQVIDAEGTQDLGSHAIVSGVGRKAERGFGLNRIMTLILQGIGANLVGKANTPTFLPRR